MPRAESGEDAVVRLYELLATRDAEAVGAHLDAVLHDDVVLSEPPSLPWGGDHRGIGRVKRIFQGMAAAPPGRAPLDPERIVVRTVVSSGDEVVAELRFPMLTATGETVDTGAVEWFSFADGRVVAIRASYFDAAAYHGTPA